MSSSRPVVSCALLLAMCSLHACTGTLGAPSGPLSDVDTQSNNARGNDDTSADGSVGSPHGGGTTLSGLPCEISDLLVQNCISCHGQTPVAGAHVSLLSLADLTAPSPTPSAGDVAHDALARMKSSGADHMPLGGGSMSSTQIAAFESWLSRGTPSGSCGPVTDDAGAPVVMNDAGSTTLPGLPCDVSGLLGKYCVSCHAATPVAGAHVSLLSFDELTAQSPTSGAGDVAHDALARMKSSGPDHMPLGGAGPSSGELAAFDAWVTGGTPSGSCGSVSDDAGAGPPVMNDAGTGGGISGLPCDVSDLLAQHCVSCHTQPPVAGAHVPMLSLADLTAQSPTSGAGDVAHDALARMQSTGNDHMPLGGADPSSAQLAAFQAWVTSETPPGSCGSITDDAGLPPAPDPTFTGPTVCTSNQHWTSGNQGSSRMHPGVACIDCHSRGEGPAFSLAGTLFPTGHEPDDCLGVNGPSQNVSVEVTDANGKVVSLTVNGSGNFYSSQSVAFPITARIVSGASVRVMATAVSSGDCNSCHTTDGRQGAPGRIALPLP